MGADGNFYGVTQLGGFGAGGTIFKMTPGGTISPLYPFNPYSQANPNPGYSPNSLIYGRDGNFYGTTSASISPYGGTFFKLTPQGALTILASFGSIGLGTGPTGNLTQDQNGNIYGITSGGGSYGYGDVFEVSPAGSIVFLASFNGSTASSIVLGGDGTVYGVTGNGGSSNLGTFFKIVYGGIQNGLYPTRLVTTLFSFNGTNGSSPDSLILGADGNFYGAAAQGGSAGLGTIFKINSSNAVTTVFTFTNASTAGSGPKSLIQGSDGNFYGLTASGGSLGGGTAFMLTPNGTMSVLASFSSANAPQGLVQGPDGNLYGTSINGGTFFNSGIVIKVLLTGGSSTLASFSNGAYPYGGLAQGNDGNFYGTTYGGGNFGYGRIFKVSSSGSLTTVASFSSSGPVGCQPQAGLTKGSDGNFYGSTASGNSGIFKMTPDGTLSLIGGLNSTTGTMPVALFQGSDGYLYGAALSGGQNYDGAVFRADPIKRSVIPVGYLSSQTGSSVGTLISGNDGKFYGIGHFGGGNLGAVFVVDPTAALASSITLLTSFPGSLGVGAVPTGLTLGQDGNFYGNTEIGGGAGGAFFKMTSDGTVTPLAVFTSAGYSPEGSPIQGSDGNFYGVAYLGGDSNLGSIFQVTPAGALTYMVSFNSSNAANVTNSGLPINNLFSSYLVQGTDGKYYGVNPAAGPSGTGLIFAMDPSGTFAATFNSAGDVGEAVAGLTINNSTLNVTLNFEPTDGTVLTVVNNTGTFPIYGTFSNLPQGGTINAVYNNQIFPFTANYAGGDGNDLTLTLAAAQPVHFADWSALHFSPDQLADPTISGPAAIPQKDGVSNLLKYFCDVDPSGPMSATDRAALPTVGSVTDETGTYLTLTFRVNHSMGEIMFSTQVSSDLANWQNVTPDRIRNLPPDLQAGDNVIEEDIKVTNATKEFIRLQVTLW